MARFTTSLVLTLMLLASAGAQAQAVREVELSFRGTVLLGDLVLPENGSLDSDAVLLTHGTLAHKDMEIIEGLQAALAERGIASLAHSLSLGIDRRRGMYDCAQPHRYLHRDAVEEIAAWLAWLRKEGASKVTVLGHSRGGNQVAWFAVEKSDPAMAGVVLLAPSVGSGQKAVAAQYRARFGVGLGPVLEEAAMLAAEGKGATLMSLPGFAYCEDTEATADSVLSHYGPEPRRLTPSLIPSIGVPVLIIAGSVDQVVPEVPERFGSLVDGNEVRLAVVEDADHFFLDFYLEDAADLVADFVRR
ncbi:alpha/beta hydrolase [Pelagibius litoralis]|uniref:Alpha/beta hydrolase n=1 Tax=Pelagibius litoralis TaxID=374515 RepID=A0A967EYE0_9PROT|nr:alpha/beta fold hydrolase [Pelagibius litoralis]NIA69723.1 alpha/beta hydrolase [Pelagibius litoralis]